MWLHPIHCFYFSPPYQHQVCCLRLGLSVNQSKDAKDATFQSLLPFSVPVISYSYRYR